jgi:hypothetical protein
MATFNYQWSNLVIMIFKQAVIAILVIMVFMIDLNPIRDIIHPPFMIQGSIEPRSTK